MVRDPSIVSPSLTGVFIGGGHNKHGTGSRCTLLKQCRPPSPRRRWRCDRSSYKRNLFSMIRAGPSSTSLPHWVSFRPQAPNSSPSARVDSNHRRNGSFLLPSEYASPPPVPGRREVGPICAARRVGKKGWGGGGRFRESKQLVDVLHAHIAHSLLIVKIPGKKHQLIILRKTCCPAVQEVRLDFRFFPTDHSGNFYERQSFT